MKLSSRFKRRQWRCRILKTVVKVSSRQELIEGWDQEVFSKTSVLLIGAGGLGGEIAEGLVRKGVGRLTVCDPDIVTPSNLNRQNFTRKNLYKNKAIELCRNLKDIGAMGTRLIAYPLTFQDLELESDVHAIICGVDNSVPDTRSMVADYCLKTNIPAVFLALSGDADWGYVFVQDCTNACWGCVFKPELWKGSSEKEDDGECPAVPATCDLTYVLAGQALYALDTLVMNRKRQWNYRTISMSNGEFGGARVIQKRPACPVCS